MSQTVLCHGIGKLTLYHRAAIHVRVSICRATMAGSLTLACTVTTSEPIETMATTLVNTPRDWDAGAYLDQRDAVDHRNIPRTLTLSSMPKVKQNRKGPHRSQSLRIVSQDRRASTSDGRTSRLRGKRLLSGDTELAQVWYISREDHVPREGK